MHLFLFKVLTLIKNRFIGNYTAQDGLGQFESSRNMEKFHRHVELIFQGPLKSKEEEEKVAYLLIWVDDKGREICQS